MTEGVLILIVIPLAVLAWRLAYAFVFPLKPHKLCGGKGLDTYCKLRGKVPRFGARWVRPDVIREWRNS